MKVPGQNTTAIAIVLTLSMIVLASFQNCAPALPLDGVVSGSAASVRATATPTINPQGTGTGGGYTGSLYEGACDTNASNDAMAKAGTDVAGGPLVVLNASGKAAIWNLSGGGLAKGAVCSIGANWQVIATGDFNGDYNPDVLWQNTTTGEVAVWLMRGATRIATASAGTLSLTYHIEGVMDFDGDGKEDLLLKSGNNVYVATMNGATLGTLTQIGTVSATTKLIDLGSYVNNDGTGKKRPLLVWYDSSGSKNTTTDTAYTFWYMSGLTIAKSANVPIGFTETTVTNADNSKTTTDFSILGVGDFNGDGQTDLLLQYSSVDAATGETTTKLRMRYLTWSAGSSALAVYGSSMDYQAPTSSYVLQSIAKVNGDAMSDWVYVVNGGTLPALEFMALNTTPQGFGFVGYVRSGYTFLTYQHL